MTAGDVGDMWFDTNDGNKLYQWSGSSWVVAQDQGIALRLSPPPTPRTPQPDTPPPLAGTKIITFYQGLPPTALSTGDLWVRHRPRQRAVPLGRLVVGQRPGHRDRLGQCLRRCCQHPGQRRDVRSRGSTGGRRRRGQHLLRAGPAVAERGGRARAGLRRHVVRHRRPAVLPVERLHQDLGRDRGLGGRCRARGRAERADHRRREDHRLLPDRHAPGGEAR